ncbi:DUF1826 domain-containing protein [Zhongshania sp.]|uniref:DUF1826 domain-containing protein n=1 Tax=Zhongshania sp. TaxID=1971902 RepID=UPI0035664D57
MSAVALSDDGVVQGDLSDPLIRRTVFSTTAECLADIYQADVNLAVWQRQLSSSVKKNCLSLLADRHFTGCRLVLAADKVARLDDAMPELLRYPDLRRDIQLLADMFLTLFGLERIGLRLTPLKDGMCPKFHVDRVPCRLITTYVGGGTEWLPHHEVNRSKLGVGSKGVNDSESGVVSSEASIQALASGDVALFKGEMWAGNEGAGLVHRSPATVPNNRLLLTLDFL